MHSFVKSIDDVFGDRAAARTASQITGGSYRLADGSVVEIGGRMIELSELIRQSVLHELVAHVEIDEQLVAPERAAELLGVTRPTIYAWQDRGKLGRVEHANQRSVPLADVEALREAREARRLKVKGDLEALPTATGDGQPGPSLFEQEAAAEGTWAHALVTGGEVTVRRRRPQG